MRAPLCILRTSHRTGPCSGTNGLRQECTLSVMSGAGKGLTQPTSTDGRPRTKPRQAGKGQAGQAMLIHLVGGDLLQIRWSSVKTKVQRHLLSTCSMQYTVTYSMTVTVQALYIEDLGLDL